MCHELISLNAYDFHNIRPCKVEPLVAQGMAKKEWQYHCLNCNPDHPLSAVTLVHPLVVQLA